MICGSCKAEFEPHGILQFTCSNCLRQEKMLEAQERARMALEERQLEAQERHQRALEERQLEREKEQREREEDRSWADDDAAYKREQDSPWAQARAEWYGALRTKLEQAQLLHAAGENERALILADDAKDLGMEALPLRGSIYKAMGNAPAYRADLEAQIRLLKEGSWNFVSDQERVFKEVSEFADETDALIIAYLDAAISWKSFPDSLAQGFARAMQSTGLSNQSKQQLRERVLVACRKWIKEQVAVLLRKPVSSATAREREYKGLRNPLIFASVWATTTMALLWASSGTKAFLFGIAVFSIALIARSRSVRRHIAATVESEQRTALVAKVANALTLSVAEAKSALGTYARPKYNAITDFLIVSVCAALIVTSLYVAGVYPSNDWTQDWNSYNGRIPGVARLVLGADGLPILEFHDKSNVFHITESEPAARLRISRCVRTLSGISCNANLSSVGGLSKYQNVPARLELDFEKRSGRVQWLPVGELASEAILDETPSSLKWAPTWLQSIIVQR
jgi:hypothetical protein